uniref:Uncharacterized protein n=1 Tax=Anopheles atroparvus TaxID=41427 RepID=A0A182JHC6_ANOAO
MVDAADAGAAHYWPINLPAGTRSGASPVKVSAYVLPVLLELIARVIHRVHVRPDVLHQELRLQEDRLRFLVPVGQTLGLLLDRLTDGIVQEGLQALARFGDLHLLQHVELLVVVSEGSGGPIAQHVLPGVAQPVD